MTSASTALVDMLADRHAKDVFVYECKMGESGSRRLDAWVMLKTWSPPTIIGYEVKVARADFLGDRKWSSYLPVCHEFYFVCPAKLIAVEELPADVGLLWMAGSRLVTKRKAPRRQPDNAALVTLMSYVLMSRHRPAADMWESGRSTPAEEWRAWLSEKREDQRLGSAVSKRIREIVGEARSKQYGAESERDKLLAVKVRLVELGLDEGAGAIDVAKKFTDGPAMAALSQIHRHVKQIDRLCEEASDARTR